MQCDPPGNKGFLYFGTNQGLDRYDGYSFKTYSSFTDNDLSEPVGYNVRCMIQDQAGDIWIGSDLGLIRFQPRLDKFHSFMHLADSFQISRQIADIAEDRNGNLWLATLTYQTQSGGLVLYDRKANQFKKFFGTETLPDFALDVELDDFGNIWVALTDRIAIIDPNQKHVIAWISTKTETKPGPLYSVLNLFNEGNGIMWASAERVAATRIHYTEKLNFNFSYVNNIIKGKSVHTGKFFKDARGEIWISTSEGVGIYNPQSQRIQNLAFGDGPYSIKESVVGPIYQDRSGTMWLGHSTIGVSRELNNKGFKILANVVGGDEQLKGNNVMGLYADSKGALWADVIDQGIHRIDFPASDSGATQVRFYRGPERVINSMVTEDDGTMWMGGEKLYKMRGETFQSIDDRFILSLLKDRKNTIWGLGDGVFQLKVNHTSPPGFIKKLPDPRLTTIQKITNYSGIAEDLKGRIWVTTWQGDIFCYRHNIDRFVRPDADRAIDSVAHLTRISTLTIDSKGRLWTPTLEGLGMYSVAESRAGDIKIKLEKIWTDKNGLVTRSGIPNLYTASLQEDLHGNIWLAQVGLSVVNASTQEVKRYDIEDGLPGNTFAFHSASKLANGYLAFGTTNGICIFHPDSLKDNLVPPKVAITDFRIFNRSVPVVSSDEKEEHEFSLSQTIPYTQEITIPYHLNVLSFEFAALDFKSSKRNSYAYQMKGFDKDWIDCGSRRTATYTNLDPGTYTFKVKASNNDGVWNEEGATIKITILPPLWATWWAYSGYAIAFIALGLFTRNRIVTRARLKMLAEVKSEEASRLRELDTLKSRFFSNVSHEFRTPLTLILVPLEKLLQTSTRDDKEELSMMHRNASRLLALINQLLDFSRVEAGTLKLKCQSGELYPFIKSITSQFQSMADSRQITFKVEARQPVLMFFDPDKLQKIITNLLSNAFKFTRDGGLIFVSIDEKARSKEFPRGYAEITVRDNGVGIAAEHLPKIFERFYQVDMSSTRGYEGSGIGLALARELIELHRGSIEVESELNAGSTFIVRLPLGKDHLKDEDIVEGTLEQQADLVSSHDYGVVAEAPAIHEPQDTLLIIEDNADLRAYFRTELGKGYKVLVAADGEEGLTVATRDVPTLIISDLMLPKKDGLTVCQEVKGDVRTSHIPVILLTAKADIESRLRGYQIGADDYIPKPFNMSELLVRIHNLIDGRKSLQKKFGRQLKVLPNDLPTTSADERFLKKAAETVEAFLTDVKFGSEVFANEMAVSQTQLYRKLHALTGEGPNEFVRNIRLHRAARLLRGKVGNVTEVAYQSGFTNLSYFAKVFKEKFGVTPNDYLKDGPENPDLD